MVYALVCFGEDRRHETMNLLNDLRNLNQKVFVITNIDLHLNHFQYDNVVELKTNLRDWTCFERFKVIKYAFENSDDEFVYYLDCDTRFFDSREEKFDSNRFEALLKSIDFDIMCPSFLYGIKHQLDKPDENENKNIRNFKFGYDTIIEYLKSKSNNYDEIIEKPTTLEGVLIFKRSKKLYDYIDELLTFSNMLIIQDTKNNRIHKACASGFAMSYFSYVYNIKIIENKIVYHFFKPNFSKEVFPYNLKLDNKEKIFLKKKLMFNNIEIHTLICNKDVYLAINNFKSLQKFEEFKDLPVYLHDDGSLTKSDKILLKDINNIVLIDRDWADREIKQYLINHPNCLDYRLGTNKIYLWHKLKTFDYFFFSKTKQILCLDTDLLFIRKPENIINLLKNNIPFYFPDIQNSYSFNEPKNEVAVLNNVNTGLIYIPSEKYYNIDALEFALSNLIKNGINYFPSWIEQSAFAHMFHQNGNYISLDAKKYRIPYFQSVDIENVECLHFVSYPSVRDLYPKYLEYLKIDLSNIIYKKDFIVTYNQIEIELNIELIKSNDNLIFKYYWGLDKTAQNQLSHEFEIQIDDNKINIKKGSELTGFFVIHSYNTNNLKLFHSYEWYGEYNWELLDIINF